MGIISKRRRAKCLKTNNLALLIVPRPGTMPQKQEKSKEYIKLIINNL